MLGPQRIFALSVAALLVAARNSFSGATVEKLSEGLPLSTQSDVNLGAAPSLHLKTNSPEAALVMAAEELAANRADTVEAHSTDAQLAKLLDDQMQSANTAADQKALQEPVIMSGVLTDVGEALMPGLIAQFEQAGIGGDEVLEYLTALNHENIDSHGRELTQGDLIAEAQRSLAAAAGKKTSPTPDSTLDTEPPSVRKTSSKKPTKKPTARKKPTHKTTHSPTVLHPSLSPTTVRPTYAPVPTTWNPTQEPTTHKPTKDPTHHPSHVPSRSPSAAPSLSPTSANPSPSPSWRIVESKSPSGAPTHATANATVNAATQQPDWVLYGGIAGAGLVLSFGAFYFRKHNRKEAKQFLRELFGGPAVSDEVFAAHDAEAARRRRPTRYANKNEIVLPPHSLHSVPKKEGGFGDRPNPDERQERRPSTVDSELGHTFNQDESEQEDPFHPKVLFDVDLGSDVPPHQPPPGPPPGGGIPGHAFRSAPPPIPGKGQPGASVGPFYSGKGKKHDNKR